MIRRNFFKTAFASVVGLLGVKTVKAVTVVEELPYSTHTIQIGGIPELPDGFLRRITYVSQHTGFAVIGDGTSEECLMTFVKGTDTEQYTTHIESTNDLLSLCKRYSRSHKITYNDATMFVYSYGTNGQILTNGMISIDWQVEIVTNIKDATAGD